jgi:hypothetical protein
VDAQELYKGLRADHELADALRERSEGDLYFFSTAVMGYKDLTLGCHKPLCDFVSYDEWKRKGTLQPRAHLKSSISTVAHSVQQPLINCEYSSIIFNEKEENAAEFLYKIRNEFATNPIINALWPERIPDLSVPGHRWSNYTAEIRRTAGSTYYAPTWQALGLKSSPTSKHVHRIKFDDMYGETAANSLTESEKVWSVYAKSDNLLIDPKKDFVDIVGTHWNTYDTYVRILEQEGALLLDQSGKNVLGMTREKPTYLWWRRSCYDPSGNPIWPERFDHETLEQMKRKLGPYMFNLQMLNNPIAESNVDFKLSEVRYWEHVPGTDAIRIFRPDEGEWSEPIYPEDVDCIQVLDPAVGLKSTHSFTAIVVLWMTNRGEVIVRDYFNDRVAKTTAAGAGWLDQLYRYQEIYQPRTTYWESVAFQKTVGEDVARRNIREPNPLNCEPIKMGYRAAAKPVRIRNVVQPALTSGVLYLHRNHDALLEQIRVHPMGRHVDVLDALSHGIPRLTQPMTAAQRHAHRRMTKAAQKNLGSYTGYGFNYGG